MDKTIKIILIIVVALVVLKMGGFKLEQFAIQPGCNTLADQSPCDGLVDRTELGSFITLWTNNQATRSDLGNAIMAWANGEIISNETYPILSKPSTSSEISTPINSGETIVVAAVKGEPESFSVTIPNTLILNNVNPTITNLVGKKYGNALPSSTFNIKWSANKINRPSTGQIAGFLLNDLNLANTTATQDVASLVPQNFPNSKGNKIWFSFTSPNTQPDIYEGNIIINSATIQYTIPIRIEILNFDLDKPVIKLGLFNSASVLTSQKSFDWIKKAQVTAVGLTACGGIELNEQACYNEQKYLYDNGINVEIIPLFPLVGWEQGRYLYNAGTGSEFKYNLEVLSPILIDKYTRINSLFAEFPGQKLGYHEDTDNGCKWDVAAPYYQLAQDYGFLVFRAAGNRPDEFYGQVNTVCYSLDYPNCYQSDGSLQPFCPAEAWNHYDPSRNYYRNYTYIWGISSRSYSRNIDVKSLGGITAEYGYPFSDQVNFPIQRNEVWRSYFSAADWYYQYSVDVINPPILGDANRYRALYIHTPNGGLIETEKSEGYLRGAWDMRYIQTLVDLMGEQQTRSFLAGLYVAPPNEYTSGSDLAQLKYKMIMKIKELKGIS